MQLSSGYITAGTEKLHYLKTGQGSKLLIAFHGYGNNAEVFRPFFPYLQKEYTIYSFDMPYHGKSDWGKDKKLEKKELVAGVNELMKEMGVQKTSLLGYSMGGRVCLTIIEQMPQHIDKTLLIAPDGLAFNPLYFFVTKTFAGKWLFKNLLTKPERYMRLVELLRQKKWVSEQRYKFAMYYLQSEASRRFLLQVWPGMSRIIPNRTRLRKEIKEYGLTVHIYMGAYDPIIPPRLGEGFKKDISTIHLHVPQKGHRVFDNDNAQEMAACLL